MASPNYLARLLWELKLWWKVRELYVKLMYDICFPLWFTSLCITNSSFIHLGSTDANPFLFTAEWYCSMCVCVHACAETHHNFFIHSPANGHLGCFHVLAIVNSVAVNIRLHRSFPSMVVSRYMPRNGISGSYHGCFVFLGTSKLFSIVAVPIYIHVSSTGVFLFLHTVSSIYCL